MEEQYYNLIKSIIILVVYLIIRIIISKIIDKSRAKRLIQETRGLVIKKVLNSILSLICLATILLAWGVDRSDLAVVLGSILTVVGVAFFAQWSLLSNVTSSIILFFNHPLKLNDDIQILEGKDYIIEGKVTNIGLFFITLTSKENEEITLPNNMFIQKSIRKIVSEPNTND